MTPYRIKRHRKRLHGGSHYALVPFIDMMTILVVFLLAHTAEIDILPNSKNIAIPQSVSERKPSRHGRGHDHQGLIVRRWAARQFHG
jgi:biopolymer transport protein ExbD